MKTQVLYCGAWSFKAPTRGITAFALRNGVYEPIGLYGEDTEAQSILAVVGKTLLAVSEKRSGAKLVSYHIEADGALTKRAELPLETPLPSYVTASPDGRYLFVSSMGSPAAQMLRLVPDGSVTRTDSFLLTGHSVTGRQGSARTHSVQVSPDGRLLAAANFGADEVELFQIDYNRESIRLIQSVAVDFGREPRHMAFAPGGRFLYLLTEEGNRLYVYRLSGDRLYELAAYDTLSPEGPQGGMAADLVVSPDGRFVYSSNREQNNLAVWRVLPSGLLDLAGHFPSGGESPRGLFISAEGDTLFCANNESGTVTVLHLDRETGVPEGIAQTLDVPFAACVRCFDTDGE